MLKAYKYRIYPTSEQIVLLAKSFGCIRWFYNFALNLTNETYKATGDILHTLPYALRHATRTGKNVIISIKDNGIGLREKIKNSVKNSTYFI
ncbi:helix-turn-helix domain-containing protein [Trichormus variabilis]|uniref:Transposase putative helix-turn-helix domain-containing protein n=1 Tax=Trichormus variabilis SAG 1403-4b TaxID=447716 RepID=A0A3S1C207_ANAVA|nr:helix-turn-helix domain-containing protein [Trichormus variabilis]RUS93847.1 hypothetical protein DSM107003_40830 [Trichormus variabilis SAG 1403-4b]